VSDLELPLWTGTPQDFRTTIERIEGWASSPSMSTLVEAFGGSTEGRAAAALLSFLDEFAASRWDFRRGAERNLATVVSFEPALDELILNHCRALGLRQSLPKREHYDAVIMTGGMVRAGIAKPRYVRMLLDSGLRADSVIFLGAFRPFGGDEHDVARGLGVDGDNEFDAMVEGLQRAFGPLGEPQIEEQIAGSPGAPFLNASWREYRWQSSGMQVKALAAPSSVPSQRRANTVDTYRFWAESRREGATNVLVVTAPVYVPYQGAGAVEVLGVEYGLAVETVGISRKTGHLGEYSQEYQPRHYLQELRSAIHGMRSLHTRLLA
jgi:hypothetical protein